MSSRRRNVLVLLNAEQLPRAAQHAQQKARAAVARYLYKKQLKRDM